MSHSTLVAPPELEAPVTLSRDALAELRALGLEAAKGGTARRMPGIDPIPRTEAIPKSAIRAPEVLNEATDYQPRPSSFSRGVSIQLQDAKFLYLSGTASVDEQGRTVYPGDFQAQCLRTLRNLTALLASEAASWHDVIRTTCYLRDIERDYDVFNDIRTLFLRRIGLDPLPASTGIQARLCRSDLLVEIEAIAVVPRQSA